MATGRATAKTSSANGVSAAAGRWCALSSSSVPVVCHFWSFSSSSSSSSVSQSFSVQAPPNSWLAVSVWKRGSSEGSRPVKQWTSTRGEGRQSEGEGEGEGSSGRSETTVDSRWQWRWQLYSGRQCRSHTDRPSPVLGRAIGRRRRGGSYLLARVSKTAMVFLLFFFLLRVSRGHSPPPQTASSGLDSLRLRERG